MNMLHKMMCCELDQLERRQEAEAAEAYHKHLDDLKKCCNKVPFHHFDSFGMPSTTLKCTECGREVVGKFFGDTMEEWNK